MFINMYLNNMHDEKNFNFNIISFYPKEVTVGKLIQFWCLLPVASYQMESK